MTNEQTIDAVMALVNDIEDQALIHACGEGAEPAAERSALLHAITAALAAKDAEIERLNHAYHQQREDTQARVDAAVLRALSAERERDRREADFQEMLKAEHRISGAYVDLRSIIGAMNPPSAQFESLTKYVSMVARKLVDERDALKARLTDSGCDLQALKADPVPGEWVGWKGGECPERNYTLVDVRLRDGDLIEFRRADSLNWHHKPEVERAWDIVAYRVRP